MNGETRIKIDELAATLPAEHRGPAVEVLTLAIGKPHSVEIKPGDGFIYRANWKLHRGQWLGLVEVIKHQSRILVKAKQTECKTCRN